jgi:hypothetical protein
MVPNMDPGLDIWLALGVNCGPREVGWKCLRPQLLVLLTGTGTRGRTYLDLWAANRVQLRTAGIEQIEVAGICTACHTEDWFSHRAEKGKTGRFGALIALPN